MCPILKSTLVLSLGLTLFLSDTAFSRGRRFGNAGFIQKGFNPCGWQSCGPRRRILQRPLFPNLRRRMSGRCGSGGGSCGSSGSNFNSGIPGGGQHGGGCGGGGCGGGGNFSGGGGQGGGVARPIADGPIASEPAAGPDFASNQSALGDSPAGVAPEGDLDPAPALPEKEENPESLASKGEAIIKASCVSCHRDGNDQGGLNLSDLDKVTKEQWKEALRRVTLPDEDPERMPQGKVLPPDQEAALIAYLEEKAGLNQEETEPAEAKPAETPTDPATKEKPSTPQAAATDRSFLPTKDQRKKDIYLLGNGRFSLVPETPEAPTTPAAQPAPSQTKTSGFSRAMASAASAATQAAQATRSAYDRVGKEAPGRIASALQDFQRFEEQAKAAQAERERNPDNEFTLSVKEAMSSPDGADFTRVLNEALNRGGQADLLAAIREERGLPENFGSKPQGKLLEMEARAELGNLEEKTNAELFSENEKANAIVFGESPDAVKNPVKRRLIEEEVSRRQNQVRQQNIQRIQEAQAQRELESVKGELQQAIEDLSSANQGLGKPALKALKRQKRFLTDPAKSTQFDVAALRKAKAKAMQRAIDKNNGVVPWLQDPRSATTTRSDVYRVLQAGENIERWIKAYEEALNSLNRLRGVK